MKRYTDVMGRIFPMMLALILGTAPLVTIVCDIVCSGGAHVLAHRPLEPAAAEHVHVHSAESHHAHSQPATRTVSTAFHAFQGKAAECRDRNDAVLVEARTHSLPTPLAHVPLNENDVLAVDRWSFSSAERQLQPQLHPRSVLPLRI